MKERRCWSRLLGMAAIYLSKSYNGALELGRQLAADSNFQIG